jgi:predicted PurR-regulated permease PerM
MSWKIFFKQHFFKIFVLGMLLFVSARILLPFMIPFVLGAVFAVNLQPAVKFVEQKNVSKMVAVILCVGALVLLFVLPVGTLLFKGAKGLVIFVESSDFSLLQLKLTQQINEWLLFLSQWMHVDVASLQNYLQNWGVEAAAFASGSITSLLKKIPEFFLMIFVFVAAVFTFLYSAIKFRTYFDRFSGFSTERREAFLVYLKSACREIMVINLIVASVQALLITAGAFIFSQADLFVVFTLTFLGAFIPFIGSWPTAALLALTEWIEANSGGALGLVLLGACALVSDNVLRPYLVSRGETSISPFLGFLGAIGGIMLLGVSGLLLGPLVMALSRHIIPLIIEEIFDTES